MALAITPIASTAITSEDTPGGSTKAYPIEGFVLEQLTSVAGQIEEAMLLKQNPEVHKNTRFGFCRGTEPVRYVRAIRDRYRAYLQVSERPTGETSKPALTQASGAGG